MTYQEYLASQRPGYTGMTHMPYSGANAVGGINSAIVQYLRDVASGKIADQGMARYGTAVKQGIAGNYGLFGDVLGDAMGSGLLGRVGKSVGSTLGNAARSELRQFESPIGSIKIDPRFDSRIKEQEKLRDLSIGIAERKIDKPIVSIADFEGRPFITSMSDRTRAGGLLTSVKGVPLNRPVDLLGGQDYMFENPGQVWASGKKPVNDLYGLAHDLRRVTGEDPIYLPWRMAPTGGDFAHMTGETMLSYAEAAMTKKAKRQLDKSIKGIVPEWKGIDSPDIAKQFVTLPYKKRKAIKQVLDRDFRDAGGLSIGEARLAVSDPNQYNAPVTGLMNVGEISTRNPIVAASGHPSYPQGVPGQGLGLLSEPLSVADLIPSHRANFQNFNDFRRSLEMKPYGGIVDEKMLKRFGL